MKYKKHHVRTINFDLYECEVKANIEFFSAPTNFSITIKGCDKAFTFRTESAQECDAWLRTIKWHIARSDGKKQSLTAPKIENFWYTDQISERQFIEEADSLDILLFKTNNTGAALQRVGT